MLVGNDNQGLAQLCKRFRELTMQVMSTANVESTPLGVPVGDSGDFPGFDRSKLYLVREGTVALTCGARTLCALQPGDLLLPDSSLADSAGGMPVHYVSETGAGLEVFSREEVVTALLADPKGASLWSDLLLTYSGIMLRLAAEQTPDETPTAARSEVFEPGEIIINQGDRADSVFHMNVGSAKVLVDGVIVGQIEGGEIFGAIAALTRSDRSATVQASSRCEVVKIPGDQFQVLIETNPETIHGLLMDMANSIVNLNEQLVGLRGSSAA